MVSKLPMVRTSNIVVQNVGKEILVYYLNTHKAYCLNEPLSIVYQACDGETSFDKFRDDHRLTDDLVFLALDELNRENLLQENLSFVSPFSGMSRRDAIRKVGFATLIALPLIAVLVAPTAAEAASAIVDCSTSPSGTPCSPPVGGKCCGSSCITTACT